MNRRDFLKLMGMATAAMIVPVSIAEAVQRPEEFAGSIDDWHRLFNEECQPITIQELTFLRKEDLGLGSMVKGLAAHKGQYRYFAMTLDRIDKMNAPEVFVRELAREIRVNLLHGFGK